MVGGKSKECEDRDHVEGIIQVVVGVGGRRALESGL